MQIARLVNHLVTLPQHVARHNLTQLSIFTKAQSRFFLGFVVIYLLVLLVLQWHVSHDPGSYFFTVQGYAPKYSVTRVRQAQAFLDNLAKPSLRRPLGVQNYEHKGKPQLCIGMPTARRLKDQHVDIAIASLLDYLTLQERDQIELNILIAHADPKEHPFYDSSAPVVNVSRLADNVLTYHDIAGGSQDITDAIQHLESAKRYNEKSFYDYALLLHQCAESQAPWVLILEDDTLAQKGWFGRTMESLRELDRGKNGGKNQGGEWLYLRLFYTEKFLGWNSEDWPSYLFWSVVTVTLTAAIGLLLRRLFSSSSSSISSLPYTAPSPKHIESDQNLLSFSFIFAVSFVCVPAVIILYFAAGRMTVQPFHSGVNVMNDFGCCSQALTFPRDMSLKLLDWLEESIDAATVHLKGDTFSANEWKHLPGPVDSSIENFANERNLQRYALVPSAFQHVGAETYKAGDTAAHEWFNISGARGIWNFGFEEINSHR